MLARLNAAVGILLGNGYGVQRDTVEERFFAGLEAVVRRFAGSETEAYVAERIMGDYRFQATDSVRRLRKHFADELVKRAEKLELHAVRRFAGWAMANDPAVEKDAWQGIAGKLIARWSRGEGDTAARPVGAGDRPDLGE